jgi:hypothetical protein
MGYFVKFQRINENRSENWENLTVETVTKFFMLFSQHRNSFSPDREMAASGNTRTVTESIVSLFADVQIKKDDTRRVISIIDKESRTFGCFWDGEQAREINQIEDIQQSEMF